MRIPSRPTFLMVSQIALLLGTVAAQAAVLSDTDVLSGLPGVPVHQEFLPGGVSVVTTRNSVSCVASRRVEIENSVYRGFDGRDIPFDSIIRSPATSLQAISSIPGEVTFRVQLKYSIAFGRPIALRIGDYVVDVQGSLENSTDSLMLTGETAARLDAALRDGVVPTLAAVSMDTGHYVVDAISAPDLAALDACTQGLGTETAAAPQVENNVRVTFRADPETTPLATLPQLQACRMKDAPGELYLATLDSVDGFFSQTDQIFVTFQPDGTLARAYVPGVFDGDFSRDRRSARLSRAADANVPTSANQVKGCLGSAEIRVCSYGPEDGQYRIGPCLGGDLLAMYPEDPGHDPKRSLRDDPVTGLTGTGGPGTAPRLPTTGTPRLPEGGPAAPPVLSNSPTGEKIIITNPAPVTPVQPWSPFTKPVISKSIDPVYDTGSTLVMSPVPLPASLLVLVGAVASLIGLRRRKSS